MSSMGTWDQTELAAKATACVAVAYGASQVGANQACQQLQLQHAVPAQLHVVPDAGEPHDEMQQRGATFQWLVRTPPIGPLRLPQQDPTAIGQDQQ